MDFLNLDPLLRLALQEDLGRGDVTTEAVLEGLEEIPEWRAEVWAKEPFVLAGWPVFLRVFQLLGQVRGEVFFREGEQVPQGPLGTLQGRVDVLLKGERLALNFLQRLSGIATQTRRYVEKLGPSPVKLLDTRKTTPLWRQLEKYAVRVGGGFNHRLGLDDGVLIKENHIALAGGIRAAVEACRRRVHHLQRIEVEVVNLEQLEEALEAGVDVILLDNMRLEEIRRAVERTAGRCQLEISGGVKGEVLSLLAATGVDFISMGALTHSARAVDVSLLLQGAAVA